MNFVKYVVKFGTAGTKHQYTKQVGVEVTPITFTEYFNAFSNTGTNERFNAYYAYGYSTFSITEEKHKELIK